MKAIPKIICSFCQIQIFGEPAVKVEDKFYHEYHTPEKTARPKLNAAQIANLGKT